MTRTTPDTDRGESDRQAETPADSTARRRSGYLWWLVPALLAGGGVLAWQLFGSNSSETEQAAPRAVAVELQRLQAATVKESSQFIGQLEAQNAVALQAETQGRVTQVIVASGDRVAARDPIVQLSPDRPEAEYRSAVANVRSAQAARANAIAEIDVAEANRADADAEVALQAEEIERTRFLVTQGALSQQDLDLAERNIRSAQAALEAADKQVGAARARLKQAEADVASAEADAAAVEEDLEDTLVVAPIAGRIGEISVKRGDYVTPDTALTAIVQNDVLDLELAVPVERRNDLEIGMQVELLEPDSDALLTTGRLSFISPQARADSQLVQVEATFPNPDRQLQDAQRVRARIVWEETRGILIPTDAVSRIGGKTFVFVAVPGESAPEAAAADAPADAPEENGQAPPLVARQRNVELGTIQDNQYQVLSGLEVGEEIVISGILNLRDGTPIQPEGGDRPGPQKTHSTGSR